MQALLDAFVFYRGNHYDLKGKQHLRTQEKHYVADIGLKLYLLGRQSENVGHLLESIVYLELRCRFAHVQVGFIDGLEIGFVTTGSSGTEYYQVSVSALDDTALRKELRPLKAIDSNCPKNLLTFDEIGLGDHDDILQENALAWLISVSE